MLYYIHNCKKKKMISFDNTSKSSSIIDYLKNYTRLGWKIILYALYMSYYKLVHVKWTKGSL